jgi:flagellar basal body P-ring formation protein FlgA
MTCPLPASARAALQRTAVVRRIARLSWVLASVAAVGGAAAQSTAAPDVLAPLLRQAQQFTFDAARHAAPGRRVEVQLGALDPRLRLAPCARAVPFLPDSARLWGRSRIGLRCERGASWRVFVPVTVKIYGTALAAAAALPAGRVIVHADLVQAVVDLAETQSQPLTEPQLALGRVLQRPLAAGQALRADHLKARVWFDAGDAVKVVARGTGFQAMGSGVALGAGVEGQVTRVKTESGRILSGRAVAPGAIDVTL